MPTYNNHKVGSIIANVCWPRGCQQNIYVHGHALDVIVVEEVIYNKKVVVINHHSSRVSKRSRIVSSSSTKKRSSSSSSSRSIIDIAHSIPDLGTLKSQHLSYGMYSEPSRGTRVQFRCAQQ